MRCIDNQKLVIKIRYSSIFSLTMAAEQYGWNGDVIQPCIFQASAQTYVFGSCYSKNSPNKYMLTLWDSAAAQYSFSQDQADLPRTELGAGQPVIILPDVWGI